MASYIAAVAQFQPTGFVNGNKDVKMVLDINLIGYERIILDSVAEKAQLIVFPEWGK